MSYIGNQPTTVAFLTDTFSGNGSTTAFTMQVAPATTSSVLVAITGVVQDPSTYAVSGTTLTFSAAPPTGTSNISVRYLGIPASGVTTTAYRTVTNFTATAGQTSFSVPSYTVGYIDVYRNGVRLAAADYTASTGTTVVLANACTVGDSVVTESFYVSSVLNAIPTTGGTIGGSLTINSASGQSPLTVQANGAYGLAVDSSGNLGIGTSSPSSYGKFAVIGKSYSSTGYALTADGSTFTPSGVTNAIPNYGLGAPETSVVSLSGFESLRYYTNQLERMRIDSSGNVGIGTSSPSTYANSQAPVLVTGTGNNFATIQGRTDGPSGATNGVSFGGSYSTNPINGSRITFNAQGGAGQQGSISFWTKALDDNTTQPLERARIDTSGNLIMAARPSGAGNTGQLQVGQAVGTIPNAYSVFTSDSASPYPLSAKGLSTNQGLVGFFDSSNTAVGSISKSGSTVAYNTSSDYRLKENIAPMTGALSVVAQLKPVTYNWKADGSDGQGFIAHELQEVVPDCVTGEKDAVDADGNPVYQGIDTSFLVATLTAAIQEQQALITQLQAEVAALKGQA